MCGDTCSHLACCQRADSFSSTPPPVPVVQSSLGNPSPTRTPPCALLSLPAESAGDAHTDQLLFQLRPQSPGALSPARGLHEFSSRLDPRSLQRPAHLPSRLAPLCSLSADGVTSHFIPKTGAFRHGGPHSPPRSLQTRARARAPCHLLTQWQVQSACSRGQAPCTHLVLPVSPLPFQVHSPLFSALLCAQEADSGSRGLREQWKGTGGQ